MRWVPDYLKQRCAYSCVIIENYVNEGTVRNIKKGLEKARGEFVYLISPGDLLYSKDVLSEMTWFLRKNRVKICFGNVVAYKKTESIELLSLDNHPLRPNIFNEKKLNDSKIAFLFEGAIYGCAYLREKKLFEE